MQKWCVLLVRYIVPDTLLIIKSFIMGFAVLGYSSLRQMNLKPQISATLFDMLQSSFSPAPGSLICL